MPEREDRSITYQQFVQRVRRHRPSEVLPAVSQAAIKKFFPKDYMVRPYIVTPWALAGVALASIVWGNEYRKPGVTDRDVLEMCAAHNEIEEPDLAQHRPGSALRFFLRMLYQQGPYQDRGGADVNRTAALFIDTLDSYGGPSLEVIDHDVWHDLVGCRLEEYIAVGWLLWAGVMHNGYFDRDWIAQDNFAEIRAVVPGDTIQRVLETYVATPAELREHAERDLAAPESRKYTFNPLVTRPLVDMRPYGDSRLIAPQPHFVLGRVTPNGLYYLGMARHGLAFSRDVGRLFEAYVGRQLALLRDVEVHSEFEYGPRKQRVKTVDYFVVFEDSVALVEVKAGRARQPTRMGEESVLVEDFDRTIGDAFDQINRSAAALRGGGKEFADIPGDRPLHGLVVTLEPFHAANASLARDLLPPADIPITVADARELEWFAAFGTTDSVADVLEQAARLPTPGLREALGRRGNPPDNPVLTHADKHSLWGT